MTSMEVCVRCHRLNTRAAVWPASLLPGALEPFQSAARRIWHPSGAALAPWLPGPGTAARLCPGTLVDGNGGAGTKS